MVLTLRPMLAGARPPPARGGPAPPPPPPPPPVAGGEARPGLAFLFLPLGREQAAALGAGLGQRPAPHDEVALRVIGAAVEDAPLARAPLDEVAAAARAANAYLRQKRAAAPALRVAAAGQ